MIFLLIEDWVRSMRSVLILFLLFTFFLTSLPIHSLLTSKTHRIAKEEDIVAQKVEWGLNISFPPSVDWSLYPVLGRNLDEDAYLEIIIVSNNSVLCVDGASGDIQWIAQINLSYRFEIAPQEVLAETISGEHPILIITDNNSVFAIDAVNGTILWKIFLGERIYSLGIIGKYVLVATNQRILWIRSGSVVESLSFNSSIRTFIVRQNIVVVSADGEIFDVGLEGIRRRFSIGANCTLRLVSIIDVDLDDELEIVLPLKNKTVIIVDVEEFVVEYSVVLPKEPLIYAFGSINKNSIHDGAFIVGDNLILLLDLADISIVDMDIKFSKLGYDEYFDVLCELYMLICDFNRDCSGVILVGIPTVGILAIIVSPGVLSYYKYFVAEEPAYEFFDSVYIVDYNGDRYWDAIVAGSLAPNMGNIRFVNGSSLSQTLSLREEYLGQLGYTVSPPILIDDIDKDGCLELVGATWVEESKEFMRSIIAYELTDTKYIYASLHQGGIYSQVAEDNDIDFLPNDMENAIGTDQKSWDTDGDTLPDGWEYLNDLDPLDPADAASDLDNDGLNNTMEFIFRGDPWNSDTDDDGLDDFDEMQIGTDLRLDDTDGDGYSDGYEVSHGSDPLNPNDHPTPFIERYWWVLIVLVVAVVSVVFFLRRIAPRRG